MTNSTAKSSPVWRPAGVIKYKALGLHWCESKFLAAEVYDDEGRLKGVRPLGGTIEFGETARDALKREYMEELGIVIQIIGEPFYLENLFEHEGVAGHEIIALYEVRFPKGAFATQNRIKFQEDNGAVCYAQWFDHKTLGQGGHPDLFPTGLREKLLK